MAEDLGRIGRIREGRVDTGSPMYANEQSVNAELIRRGLTNAGFGLDDAHWHTQTKKGKATKYVVSLAFSKMELPITPFDRKTTEGFRKLARTSWACHVWLNPNGVVTCNFVNINKEDALRQLTVRDNRIVLVPADGSDPRPQDLPGVPLDHVRMVLVKFFFTNPNRIPKEIEQVERPSDAEMDRRHAAEVEPK